MRTKHLNFDFKVKKSSKDSVTIEGLANAATIDRMKEKILPGAWDLSNYLKNPVVLFDHGHDPTFGFMPIGKAVLVEARDEGLYTKIELSRSTSEKISAIRDLVEEGILKTFSVGFDPKASEKSADDPEVMHITKAELIETSIVPIPMNQDSTFSTLSHRKAYWHSPVAKKWYDSFYDRVSLIKKGAFVAAAVHQRLHDLMEIGEVRNRSAALRFMAEEADTTVAQVQQAMGGNLKALTPKMLHAFASVLKIDRKLLTSLNRGDLSLFERVMAREDQDLIDGKGGEEMARKKKADAKKKPARAPAAKADGQTPPAEEKPKDDEEKPKDGEGEADAGKAMAEADAVIHQVIVPKDAYASQEEAAKVVGEAGYSVDQASETDEAYVFTQVPDDQVDGDKGMLLDIGGGLYCHVAPKKAAGSGDTPPADEGKGAKADEAKAAADQAAEDEAAAAEDEEPADDEAEGAEDEEENEEADAGALVAKAAEILKAGADGAAAEALKLLEEAQALLDAAESKGGHPGASKGVSGTDDNPYLELARGQNAMLGAILNELKGMSGKLDGVADLSLDLAEDDAKSKGEDDEDEGKDSEEAKSLDSIRMYQQDLDRKLKKNFGV